MELSGKSSKEHSKCMMSCEAEVIGKSSVHALSQLSQAKSSCARIFWIIVFVITLSGCAYQVYSFLQVYLQYPVLIDLKYQRVMASDFPAVTVCNLNKITRNHIQCVKESLTWDQCHSYRRKTFCRYSFCQQFFGQGGGGISLYQTQAQSFTSTSNTNESPKSYNESAKSLLNRYTKLDDMSRRCYGHGLDDFVLKAFDFLAVTVCNLNSTTLNHIQCVNESITRDPCHSYKINSCLYSFCQQFFQQSGSGGFPLYQTQAQSLTSTSNTSEWRKSYNEFAKNLLNRYTNLDDMTRRCYGHRLDDFVLKCSFNSVTCDYSDFQYFLSKQYGNCFTFNRKTESDLGAKPRIVKRAGPQSGLELVLDIGLNSYSYITPSFGVRVVIHNPQEDPHPAIKGVNIPVGVESHLSLAKTSFHRLATPYRDDCKNYPPSGGLNCVDECIQRVSMELCGCVDPFLMAASPKKVLCNLLNETQTACMSRVLDLLSSNVEVRLNMCDCRLPCFSTEYDVQLQNTVMNWSSVMRSVMMSDRHFGKIYEPEECRGEKAITPPTKLKVFFKTLDHKIYVQKPMFSDSELYSQLGGNLNLWLGLSFVAMYEFAEKVFLFVKVALHTY